MTTALPPSGRSSLLLGVNPSIEPFLKIPEKGPASVTLAKLIAARRLPGTASDLVVSPSGRPRATWIETAADIRYPRHLTVFDVAARLVDDSVSKTINLPADCAVEDVDEIYSSAWAMGLKAISIYRAPEPPRRDMAPSNH
jgi:ribonucleoside-diphosphate reductase alpha chain